jgi:protein O-mannosyl-transferase
MKIGMQSGLDRSSADATVADPRAARRSALICLLLVLATLAAFWPVMSAQFITLDDADYVTSNPHVRQGLSPESIIWALGTGRAANWHPVTWWSHMLDVQVFGLDAAGPHSINLLLHIGSTLLLFLLLKELTSATWRSALVAALFALHPLHVESVAWISERKDVLSGLFWLLTLWFYCRYARELPGTAAPESGGGTPVAFGRKRCNYILALLFFALGLMSKPMLVTIPFVLLLLDFWPLGRVPGARPEVSGVGYQVSGSERDGGARGETAAGRWFWVEKIPFFALSAISCAVTFLVQRKGGAISSIETYSIGARIGNVLVSYARYAAKIIWPANLAVPYPHPGHWPTMWVIGALVFVSCAGIAAWCLRRRLPFVFTGWFWFAGTLVPVIGLVQVGGQSIADRYTYVPAIGLFIALVWGAERLVARWRLPGWFSGTIAAVLLATCAFQTRTQAGYWQNSEKLFRHTLAVTGDNAVAFENVGFYLEHAGDLAGAMEQFRQALRLNPNNHRVYEHMGLCSYKQGRIEEAIEYYRQALRLMPDDPSTLNDLGSAQVSQGKYEEAIRSYEAALRCRPDYTEAYNNLGVVLNEIGRTSEAIEQYNKALKLMPDDVEAHSNLGNALAASGRLNEAAAHYLSALRFNPDFTQALNNLGLVLSLQGKHSEAVACYERAVELKPRDPTVRSNFGDALARARRDDLAIPQYLEALRLATNYAEPHFGLGCALARTGRRTEAIGHLTEALRLKPDYPEAKQQLKALNPPAPE